MTVAAAVLPSREDRQGDVRSALAACTAPALVLLAVVVPFLRFHEYDLLLPESLILLLAAAGFGAAAGRLSLLRPQTLEPAVLACALGVYTFVRLEFLDGLVTGVSLRTGNFMVALGGLLVLLCFCVFLLAWLLRSHLRPLVIAVFGTIVVSTLVLSTDTGGAPVETGGNPAALSDLPPVIHVILDEHIGLAGLPSDAPESAAAARAMRKAYADFALYGRAYSRFAETMFSLASLMNHDLQEDAAGLLESRHPGYALGESDWFDGLKGQGYSVRVYQSAWLDMCASASVDYCYTYQVYSPNPVQRSSLSTEARLRVLVAKLLAGRRVGQLSPMGSSEALARFRADIEATPRGVAYVVHLLLPHFGYLYDADCALADPADWEKDPPEGGALYTAVERRELYRAYLPQLDCATDRMAELFAHLKALGIYDEATIVVHGDHGSRIGQRPFIHDPASELTQQDLIDHFSTLLAVKAPGVAPGLYEEPVVLQEAFDRLLMQGEADADPASRQVLLREHAGKFGRRDLVWPDATPSASGRDSRLAVWPLTDLRRLP